MTKTEKRRFVRELIAAVQKDILAKVDAMPEEWDGHELRAYIAEQFEACKMTVGRKGEYANPYRARTRAYRNEVLTRNL